MWPSISVEGMGAPSSMGTFIVWKDSQRMSWTKYGNKMGFSPPPPKNWWHSFNKLKNAPCFQRIYIPGNTENTQYPFNPHIHFIRGKLIKAKYLWKVAKLWLDLLSWACIWCLLLDPLRTWSSKAAGLATSPSSEPLKLLVPTHIHRRWRSEPRWGPKPSILDSAAEGALQEEGGQQSQLLGQGSLLPVKVSWTSVEQGEVYL